jgi:predicted RNA binding protein YcfA (HicA-like mRNA interferase family)
MKYKEIIKLLEANGWYFHHMGKGDHMIYRHSNPPRSIVVSAGGKLNRDIPPGTENALLRQAGLK